MPLFLPGRFHHAPVSQIESGIVHAQPGGSLLPPTGIPAPQGRVRKGDIEGCLDDVVGHGFLLVSRQDPLRYLDEGQQAFLNELGCRIVVLSADASISGAVVEIDGDQEAFLSAHGMQAYVSRPDFAVFGSVSDMKNLPTLVDALQQKLHWRGTTQGSMSVGKSEAALS